MVDDTLYLPLGPIRGHRYRRDKLDIIEFISKYFVITLAFLAITSGYFLVYEFFGKTNSINQHQDTLKTQLQKQWNINVPSIKIPPKPIPGDAIALITIPRIDKTLAVVEGTSLADIANAPGHYSNTALPGQKGNFAMAGHRSKAIFLDLDKVKIGDTIEVDTRTRVYTYKVKTTLVTSPYAFSEVSPVPPGYKQGQKILTITTCNPWWDNTQRLIVHALLVKSEKR